VSDAWSRLKAFGLSVWISELEDLLSSLVPYGQSVRVDLSEFEAETTPEADPTPEPAPEPESQSRTEEDEENPDA
jgi:hypothetical protein